MQRRVFLETAGAAVAGAAGLTAQSGGRSLNIGCIGVGSRGTAHLKNLLKLEGVAIRAVCDDDVVHLEKAQAMVVEAGKPKPEGYSEWKKLLERKDIDAVISALPCDLHAANYLDVIAAGKDLYAEKPMALAVRDCEAVVAAARKSKNIVQVGFQRRADPRNIETMRRVHEGELGELVEARVLWSIGASWGPLGGWLGKRQRSGDWMVEQAVHNWDVINWATRCRPVAAMGIGRSDLFRKSPITVDNVCGTKAVQADRNVHDYYSGVMQFENGVIANIIHSWVPPRSFNDEYTRLIGTRGGLDFNTGLISYRHELNLPDRVRPTDDKLPDRDMAAILAFLDSVRTRKPPVANVEHGREAVLTCLLMREAVYRKKPVTLKDVLG